MSKITKTLTNAQVQKQVRDAIALFNADQPPKGKEIKISVGGVAGLCVRVRGANSITWLLRIRGRGGQKDTTETLGTFSELTLQQAREKSREFIANGGKQKEEKPKRIPTVSELWPQFVEDMINASERGWKDPRARVVKNHFGRDHVFPIVGGLTPDQISFGEVAMLMNATQSKSEQDKVFTITRQFLKWAIPRGFRATQWLPTDRGVLQTLIQGKRKTGNYPALNWPEIPRFMKALIDGGLYSGVGSSALFLKILTASRSTPIELATWANIDLNEAMWVCPAEDMKIKESKQGKKRPDHTVPLSTQAVQFLKIHKSLTRGEGMALVFSGKMGKRMSENTMAKAIRTLSAKDEKHGGEGFRDATQNDAIVTPHGFRASFRSWAREQRISNEISGFCLAHIDKEDSYNGAYDRFVELLPERRDALQRWADYCLSECPEDWWKIK